MSIGARDKIDLKLKHLDYVQAAITRLSGNSAAQKNYCISLVSALVGVAIVLKDPDLLLIAIFPSIVCGFLDLRYLRAEHGYRDLFDELRKVDSEVETDFNMKPVASSFRRALASWSIWPFYGGLLAGVTFLYTWMECK